MTRPKAKARRSAPAKFGRCKGAIRKLWRAALTPPATLHPDDGEMWRVGVRDATKLGQAFAAEYAAELLQLVTVYPDNVAHDMLEALREAFWAGPVRVRRHG